jgi:hypothetical protein
MERLEGLRRGFLADLTTSEGQLHRFTAICHIMRDRGILATDMLTSCIREELGLTNIKVINRHLRVMESLGLLVREDIGYVPSSEGKALCALVPPASRKGLELAEKVFYLRALGSYASLQFTSILAAISENANAPKERAITSYAQKTMAGSTWRDKVNLKLRLSRQPDSPPRKVRNNFDCFRLWLKQLELVRPDALQLTKVGGVLADVVRRQENELREKVYWAAAAYICRTPGCLPEFEYGDQFSQTYFLELLHNAYRLFEKPELRLSDARSMSIYVCIKLLVEGHRILNERSFWQLIGMLLRDGIIESAVAGRDGKPAYISLGFDVKY